MVYLLLFLLGLAIGSFLNVVVYREVNEIKSKREKDWLGEIKGWLPPWVNGRSICDYCKKQLSWSDNIPVLSYILLRGKCRYCHKDIPVQYPLVELITALEFVWLYWLLQKLAFFGQVEGFFSFALAAYWFFIASVTLIIALVDLRTKYIPDAVIMPAIVVSIIRLVFTGQWYFLLTGFIAALFFYLLYLVTKKKGMGFGDVKLAFFIGLVLGWWQRAVVAFFLAFLTGAVVGVIVVLVKKKSIKSAIPFGPFLLLGMWLAKLFGDQIWDVYLSFLK